jgi:hypothetical protein
VHAQAWRDVICEPVATNYQKFAAAVASSVNDAPDFRHAAMLQKTLDLCFTPEASAGVSLT